MDLVGGSFMVMPLPGRSGRGRLVGVRCILSSFLRRKPRRERLRLPSQSLDVPLNALVDRLHRIAPSGGDLVRCELQLLLEGLVVPVESRLRSRTDLVENASCALRLGELAREP